MAHPSFSQIPSVNQILESREVAGLSDRFARRLIVDAVRQELLVIRERIGNGTFQINMVDLKTLGFQVEQRLVKTTQLRFQPVINATGILLHTNLGRAPLAPEAVEAVRNTASGYCNLELDLETGKRTSRQNIVRDWLCRLTGAESATVVNNNAAATIIVLRATSLGKEVVLSRGQLVEIGGGFRIPEIMMVSGAILREVGTTNITRLSDYERAISSNTGALLQIHTSNFRIRGHTQSVSLPDLVGLGHQFQIPVIDDVGSGAFVDLKPFGFDEEPLPRESIARGADLVIFSGDKLLGGPQVGIILGKKVWIERIEKDPLMRAFRLDKMSLCALESTLQLYLDDNQALQSIPVLAMLGIPLDELNRRCHQVRKQLDGCPWIESIQVLEGESFVGGGSLPDQGLKTWLVEIAVGDNNAGVIAKNLRSNQPALMTRVKNNRIILDLRTVLTQQTESLIKTLMTVETGPTRAIIQGNSIAPDLLGDESNGNEIIEP